MQTHVLSIPALDSIVIEYEGDDPSGGDRHDPDCAALRFRGKIVGVQYWTLNEAEDVLEDKESRHDLGTVEFALIDLWHSPPWIEILDAISGEWVNHYHPVVVKALDDDAMMEVPSQLLVLDRLDLKPEARGYGIGLHVLARVIRTFGRHATLVALTAFPTETDEKTDYPAACKALGRYYRRLGVRQFRRGDTVHWGTSASLQGEKLEKLLDWKPAKQHDPRFGGARSMTGGTMMALKTRLPARELRVGDRVEMESGPWGEVTSIRDYPNLVRLGIDGVEGLYRPTDLVTVVLEDDGR